MRAALTVAVVLALFPAAAEAAPRLTQVGTFDAPVHVTGPPGDPSRLFVVEKPGRVQVLVNGQRVAPSGSAPAGFARGGSGSRPA